MSTSSFPVSHFHDRNKPTEIETENYSVWLKQTKQSYQNKKDAIVPCGDCRGCCTSGYFIHIKPEETKTLSKIPKALLFSAPGLPKGHVLLGFNEKGHCPLFVNNQCSIYAFRPQTCRKYDCRIYPATRFKVEDSKPLIAEQTQRWRFKFSSEQDLNDYQAVQRAAKFIQTHSHHFPKEFLPNHSVQLAVLAIKVYALFLLPTDNLPQDQSPSWIEKRVALIVAKCRKSNL